jgi:hypothetical protein
LRNSMMRVSPEPGCDADFRRVAAASRNRTPKAEGRRIAGPGPPSRNGLFGPIALGKGIEELRSGSAPVVLVGWPRHAKASAIPVLSSCSFDGELRKTTAFLRGRLRPPQVGDGADSRSRLFSVEPPSQALRCIICKKVKPCILRCPRNCQLIHTVVPTKDISIGRAPANVARAARLMY